MHRSTLFRRFIGGWLHWWLCLYRWVTHREALSLTIQSLPPGAVGCQEDPGVTAGKGTRRRMLLPSGLLPFLLPSVMGFKIRPAVRNVPSTPAMPQSWEENLLWISVDCCREILLSLPHLQSTRWFLDHVPGSTGKKYPPLEPWMSRKTWESMSGWFESLQQN